MPVSKIIIQMNTSKLWPNTQHRFFNCAEPSNFAGNLKPLHNFEAICGEYISNRCILTVVIVAPPARLCAILACDLFVIIGVFLPFFNNRASFEYSNRPRMELVINVRKKLVWKKRWTKMPTTVGFIDDSLSPCYEMIHAFFVSELRTYV